MPKEVWVGEIPMSAITQRVTDELNALLKELVDNPPTLSIQDVRVALASGDRLLGARDGEGGRLVGCAVLAPTRTLMGLKCLLEDVAVLQDYRRRGIARRLVRLAKVMAQAAGATSLNLTSGQWRTAANALYLAEGFEQRDTNAYCLTF